MAVRGDIRVNEKTHPPGTPRHEIWDFEIWDGEKWLPASTAKDILYKVGSGAGGDISQHFVDKQENKNGR